MCEKLDQVLSKMQEFEAGSLEWLEARNQNVTATEVSCLFGLNKYKSAKKLIEDKIHPTKIWSPFLRRGRILEPAVTQCFREDMKWNVRPVCDGAAFFKLDDCRLSATPDALLFASDGSLSAVIECKTASETRMNDWDSGVPLYYALQVHVQMMCLGMDKAYIGCLGAFDPFPFLVYEITPNYKINEMIKKRVDLFWKMYDTKDTYIVDPKEKSIMIDLLTQNMGRLY